MGTKNFEVGLKQVRKGVTTRSANSSAINAEGLKPTETALRRTSAVVLGGGGFSRTKKGGSTKVGKKIPKKMCHSQQPEG